MTVRCVECRLFNLQLYPEMAKQGYGRCGLAATPPGRFESAVFPRLCDDFKRAPDIDIERRITWLNEQREKLFAQYRQTPNGRVAEKK